MLIRAAWSQKEPSDESFQNSNLAYRVVQGRRPQLSMPAKPIAINCWFPLHFALRFTLAPVNKCMYAKLESTLHDLNVMTGFLRSSTRVRLKVPVRRSKFPAYRFSSSARLSAIIHSPWTSASCSSSLARGTRLDREMFIFESYCRATTDCEGLVRGGELNISAQHCENARWVQSWTAFTMREPSNCTSSRLFHTRRSALPLRFCWCKSASACTRIYAIRISDRHGRPQHCNSGSFT